MPVIVGVGFMVVIGSFAPHFVIPVALLALAAAAMMAMPEWVPVPVAVAPVVAAVVAGMALTL